MGRELRIDGSGRRQHRPGACKVRHIGVCLAGEHRIVRHAVHLRALDLGVPVRAFDQPHHEPVFRFATQRNQPVDQRTRALLIGLDHEPDPVPALQGRIACQKFHHIQRQLQPIRFLGIDVEPDVVLPCQPREGEQAGTEFCVHPRGLRPGVARMQRGELNGDSRAIDDALALRMPADGVDRLLVCGQVRLRIGIGCSTLPQHIERIPVAARLAFAHVLQRFIDRPTSDKLAAQKSHRQVHALAHQWFAAFAQQRGNRLFEGAFGACVDQFPGDQQAPRRGVDKQRRAAPKMGVPVPLADLVANKPIAGRGVGNSQQRLSQAHQRDAFTAVERKLQHQRVHTAGAAARVAHALGQAPGQLPHRRRLGIGPTCFGDQAGHHRGLGCAVRIGNRPARWRGNAWRVEQLERGHEWDLLFACGGKSAHNSVSIIGMQGAAR